jgi:hypothetical protein
MALFLFKEVTMNADPDQQRPTPSHRPTFRLLTRDAPKPTMDVKPVPREEDHPADEPGYGHGV